MQPARGLPASAPLQREIAHVRSDLRPSRTRPSWLPTCAAAWPEPRNALAHGARRQSDELRLGLDVAMLVEVHLHAAVLVGVASAAQVVAGVVVLRELPASDGIPNSEPSPGMSGASRRDRPVDTY
jgi:hypothetical protein